MGAVCGVDGRYNDTPYTNARCERYTEIYREREREIERDD